MGQMAHQDTQARRPAEAHRAISKVGATRKSNFIRTGLLDEAFKVIQKLRLNLTEKDLLRLLP